MILIFIFQRKIGNLLWEGEDKDHDMIFYEFKVFPDSQ